MSSDDFYWYASIFIFLPWLLLMFVPNWRHTELVAFIAAILLFLVAAWFTFSYLSSESAGGNLWSLEGFKNLFRNKEM
ncbi:MAG: abscisic acid-deficient protein Aba4 family protein, partial [Saprospiraceae bacterium]